MRFILSLLVIFTALTTQATIKGSPFEPEVDARFNVLENQTAGGTLADSKLLVGNSSNVSTARTISGDVTIGNTGVTAIGANKVLETMIKAQSADGLHLKRIARATYDVAVNLGTVAAHGLGVSLPANAIIVRSWFYVVTQFVDAGSGTVAISCEDANNIKTATDITGSAAGAIVEGESTGAASAFKASIAAACEITATVATAAQTAGKLIVFVEYVVAE